MAELFKVKGIYKGWNSPAWIAFIISIIPVIPGFMVAVGISSADQFPAWLVNLYSYAWFVTFILSFILYMIFMKPDKAIHNS